MGINIYNAEGYLDIPRIKKFGLPFVFIVGGRGTGKTYGALEDVVENKIYSIYMRRTQTQCDLMLDPRYSPFTDLNIDKGWDIVVEPDVKNLGIYKDVNDKEEKGLVGALTTFGNIRGFSGRRVKELIYDEFIPEPHHHKIKREGNAFYNAYETVNRNRELKGEPPVQCLCLSNSENIKCDLLADLKLINHFERMAKKNQEVKILNERGLMIIYLRHSKISEAKKQTALYKLTAGTDYADMALANEFKGLSHNNVGRVQLREFNPFLQVGEICIYYHKKWNKYYCTYHISGSPKIYGRSNQELVLMRQRYSFMLSRYITKDIKFENYECEVMFQKYFDINM